MAILAVFAGLVILVKGGDWLLQSAVSLSLKLQIPKIVVGMTVVSFATSMPELIVSVQSALSGHPDLAFGNVLGSNIANIAFVLAVVIIIAPINVSNSFYKTDFPMMIFATALFYVFVAFDSKLESYEGAILFSILILFLFAKKNISSGSNVPSICKCNSALGDFFINSSIFIMSFKLLLISLDLQQYFLEY